MVIVYVLLFTTNVDRYP